MKKSDTHTWDSLTWTISKRNSNLRRCEVILLAGETLLLEEGSRVFGPCRVILRHNTHTKRIYATYLPLTSEQLDLDNPLEFPCGYCGAERLEPCIGFNEKCVYRVFSINNGMLA